MYKHTIEQLQIVLDLSDAELAEKLNVNLNVLNRMKRDNLRCDYIKVKCVLVDERVKLIKFLK